MNDGRRWIFEEVGEPSDFEEVERYGLRRKRDEFTPRCSTPTAVRLGCVRWTKLLRGAGFASDEHVRIQAQSTPLGVNDLHGNVHPWIRAGAVARVVVTTPISAAQGLFPSMEVALLCAVQQRATAIKAVSQPLEHLAGGRREDLRAVSIVIENWARRAEAGWPYPRST
jgi:hypothetical protein